MRPRSQDRQAGRGGTHPTGRSDSPAEAGYSRRLTLVNAGLEAVLPGLAVEPQGLHAAMRHAVLGGGGGKRLRPVVLLTIAADLGLAVDRALPVAMALELVHCYSLVHDDLPCMDNASVRRGAPTVHAAFGYADAILAGDALLTLAFEVLGRAGNSGLARSGDLVVDLALAAGSVGLAGGQHADLARTDVVAARLAVGGENPVLAVHRLKTAKLFGFAFAASGCLVSPSERGSLVKNLKAAGESFGLAFQVADDIRDLAEDELAPNYAKMAGVEEARRVALAAAEKCLGNLGVAVGPRAESPRLVRAALAELGLAALG